MAFADEFQPTQVAEKITAGIQQRMEEADVSPDVIQQDLTLLMEFARIAGEQILQQGEIPIPHTDQALPYDVGMATQCVELFVEGMYYAMTRCQNLHVEGEIRGEILGNVAQHTFEQVKQVVVSTYGQEMTPALQFSPEQQMEMVNQAAESALFHYINEYESQNGPIQPPEPEPLESDETAEPTESVLDETPVAGSPQQNEQPQQPVQPGPGSGGENHEKYAAVALAMTALKPSQRDRIMAMFNGNERELIGYYSHLENISRNLNMAAVSEQLKDFKTHVIQGMLGHMAAQTSGLAEILQQQPKETILRCVKNERPGVQLYLASFFDDPEDELNDALVVNGQNPTSKKIIAP